MTKIIYLDIDGVLNCHKPYRNGYCGMDLKCVENFNLLLGGVADAKIIVTSAWRYNVHNGSMNVKGLEALFLTHGVAAHDRLIAVTKADEHFYSVASMTSETEKYNYLKEHGAEIRVRQIQQSVIIFRPNTYIVLDDLELPMDAYHLIKTKPYEGLTYKHVKKAVEILNYE